MTGYRQFINKIWNASRFLLMNIGDLPARRRCAGAGSAPHPPLDPQRCEPLAIDVNDALTTYRFDQAADRLYHFFWHEFADWYIEFAKVTAAGRAGARRGGPVLVRCTTG